MNSNNLNLIVEWGILEDQLAQETRGLKNEQKVGDARIRRGQEQLQEAQKHRDMAHKELVRLKRTAQQHAQQIAGNNSGKDAVNGNQIDKKLTEVVVALYNAEIITEKQDKFALIEPIKKLSVPPLPLTPR